MGVGVWCKRSLRGKARAAVDHISLSGKMETYQNIELTPQRDTSNQCKEFANKVSNSIALHRLPNCIVGENIQAVVAHQQSTILSTKISCRPVYAEVIRLH
jgi:hypothetical protein